MGRSPRGERGLKRERKEGGTVQIRSLPTWGAWIETPHRGQVPTILRSLPTWGAWIETS